MLIQQHHYQAVNGSGSSPLNKSSLDGTPPLSELATSREVMDEVPEMEGVVDKMISAGEEWIIEVK